MKKLFLPLVFIIVFLFAACTSDIVKNGGAVEHGTPLPTADIESAYEGETIVYITESGTKYHSGDCPHLAKSKIPITLEQAKEQGYEPCSVCNPPT